MCNRFPVRIESFIAETERHAPQRKDKAFLNKISTSANTLLLEIRSKLEDEHLTVPDWINVKSSQHVLSTLGATCASCRKTWTGNRLASDSRNQGSFAEEVSQTVLHQVRPENSIGGYFDHIS